MYSLTNGFCIFTTFFFFKFTVYDDLVLIVFDKVVSYVSLLSSEKFLMKYNLLFLVDDFEVFTIKTGNVDKPL